MTNEDVRSELEKQPFRPLRFHLVSGKTVEVRFSGIAYMLQNAVLIFHDPSGRDDDAGYDTLALRNIERIEQIY